MKLKSIKQILEENPDAKFSASSGYLVNHEPFWVIPPAHFFVFCGEHFEKEDLPLGFPAEPHESWFEDEEPLEEVVKREARRLIGDDKVADIELREQKPRLKFSDLACFRNTDGYFVMVVKGSERCKEFEIVVSNSPNYWEQVEVEI